MPDSDIKGFESKGKIFSFTVSGFRSRCCNFEYCTIVEEHQNISKPDSSSPSKQDIGYIFLISI